MYEYMVICDGGRNKDGAYGSFKVFKIETGELVSHHFMYFGTGTSNTAEYLALINSIEFCIRSGFSSVLFKTDSLLVVNQVNGIWRSSKNAQHLKPLIRRVKNKLSKLDKASVVKIKGELVKEILGH